MNNERTATFETKCEPCVFATLENGEQVGCQLGRIGKFKQQGLVEPDGDTYYKINSFCNACRNSYWAEKQEDIFESIEEEIAVKCDIMIVAENSTKSEILETINSVKGKVIIYPNKLFIILNSPDIKIVQLFDDINSLLKDTGIKFEIMKVVDKEKPMLEHVDNAVEKSKSQYYGLFKAGNRVPEDFLQTINDLLNVELSRFVMINASDKYNGLVVQNHIHKALRGNKDGATIDEKIKWLANEQDNKSLIKKWEYDGQPT